MAIVFLVFGLIVASASLLAGAVPDPWRMMGFIKREREPRRFYIIIGSYVLMAALISAGSWWANDSAKHATDNASPRSRAQSLN